MNPLLFVAFTAAAIFVTPLSSDKQHADPLPHSVEGWSTQLRDNNFRARLRALDALGLLGPAAVSTVPILIKTIEDPNLEVQIAAVDALGLVGPPARAAIPALIRRLADDQLSIEGFPPRSNHHAAHSLALIGAPAVAPLIAVLNRPVLNEQGERTRERAVYALMRMGPAAHKAVPALLGLVRDTQGLVDEDILHALGRIGPAAADAIPALEKLLREEGYVGEGALKDTSLRIMYTLSQLGSGPTPELITDLVSRDPSRRSGAVAAIRYFGSCAKTVVPALLLSFKDENLERGGLTVEEFSDLFGEIRLGSALAVGEIDPVPEAVQNLVVLLRKHKAPNTTVVYTLGKIGPAAMPAISDLIGALEHTKEDERAAIIKVLPFIDTSGRIVVPALARMVGKADGPSRDAAIIALGRIGPGAQRAIPAIARTLKDDETRRLAAVALGRIGSEARETVPALIEALNDERARPAVADALRRIGPAAKPSIPVLRELLGDDRVGATVAVALLRLDPECLAIVADRADHSENDVFRAIVKSACGEETPEGRGIVHQALIRLDDAVVGDYLSGDYGAVPGILKDLDRIAALPIESRAALPKIADLLHHKSLDVRARAKQILDDQREGNLGGIQSRPQPR